MCIKGESLHFDKCIKAFTKNIQKVLKRFKNNSIVKKDYTTEV
ncbi:hypothetical protein GCM10007380_21300 [Gottfriedia solisilvae]|uniref:Uncharacterized protein n=1 Tax=Gottfriedia solisilvae TaxID=1516104 RepID=A0A8J3AHT0_9BACI|nr:hypothetical protein GCM10007380_21300 [Gottfriedia solisilvae]